MPGKRGDVLSKADTQKRLQANGELRKRAARAEIAAPQRKIPPLSQLDDR
jgi:hypothetical protein